MIVVPGHNQLGNVLHLIVGPESEFHLDLHGAKIMDLTDVLQQLDGTSERIFLCLTRSKSEAATEHTLTQTDIPHKSSFGGIPMCDAPDCAVVKGTKLPQAEPARPTARKSAPSQSELAECEYCGGKKPLLPIAAFKVCLDCVKIELGLRRAAKPTDTAKGPELDA